MIYVEFFDRVPLENICSCIAAMPEKVILIGNDKKRMGKHKERYQNILKARGIETEFIPYVAGKHSLQHQIQVLTDIVETYDTCVFDLTGGEELSLVAAGIVYERYKETNRIRLQRVNIKNNTVMDCEVDGDAEESPLPDLSVDENILLYGGDVVYADDTDGACTAVWKDSESFFSDVDKLWKISAADPKAWGEQMGKLALAEKYREAEESDACTTVFDLKHNERIEFVCDFSLLDALQEQRLIQYTYDDLRFCITYKNEQVKKCMSKEGMALEMKVYVTAKRLTEDGNPVYNDVKNGMIIDWNGNFFESGNTINEVDVCMMHRSVPVFISCKCGNVTVDELFKLNAVAEHFGGVYAKKALVMNHLPEENNFKEYFLHRATDLNIQVIYNAHRLPEERLQQRIKALCNN